MTNLTRFFHPGFECPEVSMWLTENFKFKHWSPKVSLPQFFTKIWLMTFQTRPHVPQFLHISDHKTFLSFLILRDWTSVSVMNLRCFGVFLVSCVCASWIMTYNTHFSMWSTSTDIFIFISHTLYIHIPNPLVPKNTLLYLNTKHRSRGQCNSSWSGATYAYSSSSRIAFTLLYWVPYWLSHI